MEKTITLQEAIAILTTAKNVNEWNAKREQIKDAVGMERWIKEFLPAIDGSGLITKVLSGK